MVCENFEEQRREHDYEDDTSSATTRNANLLCTRKGCLVGRPLGMGGRVVGRVGGRVVGRQSDKELDAGKSSPGQGLKVVVWAIFLGKANLEHQHCPHKKLRDEI